MSETKKILLGHTSQETAYLVEDYPYGFKQRCRIRFWIECNVTKKTGLKKFRFVSQTEKPGTTRWNKPKESTYVDFSAAMWLDEKGHVQWTGLGSFDSDERVLKFVTDFPEADLSQLKELAPIKVKIWKQFISGERAGFVNGVRQEQGPDDLERLKKELATWENIVAKLAIPVSQ